MRVSNIACMCLLLCVCVTVCTHVCMCVYYMFITAEGDLEGDERGLDSTLIVALSFCVRIADSRCLLSFCVCVCVCVRGCECVCACVDFPAYLCTCIWITK